jgi:tRNA pseudouridine55 synthase
MLARYHGILNLNKPMDWTSHDVVAKVRRILGQREVGHAGTLDPLATGVLLICVGQATRVAEYLMVSEKVYRAVARLGVTTDTYDKDGQVVAEAPIPKLTRQDLLRALKPFSGEILQRPPAYSAIKQDGEPAHRKARRGKVVEIEPRLVTIHRVDLLDWHSPHLTIEVTCGPGTYIRSLTHDLGQALGCGAVLIQLTRLRSGPFMLEDAVELEKLAHAAGTGQVARFLHPFVGAGLVEDPRKGAPALEAALRYAGLTRVPVNAEEATRLAHGQAILCPTPPATEGGYAITPDGSVVAILTHDPAHGLWRPRKVFVTSNEYE